MLYGGKGAVLPITDVKVAHRWIWHKTRGIVGCRDVRRIEGIHKIHII